VCWTAGRVTYVGTAGSVKYVELQEVSIVWNCKLCEVCGIAGGVKYMGTAGCVNYVELQEA
jgi:hypothetical protein